MRIDVVGLNLEVTDAIRGYAEQKVAKLDKFSDLIQSIMVRMEVEDSHGPNEFKVELTVDVEHHDDFVSTATGEDLYGVIDQAVQKSLRQLGDHKNRLKVKKH